MVKINPRKIKGNWVRGYVLDEHTVSSTFLGYDQYGNEKFDTKRSEIGEMLYKLKYESYKTTLKPIVEVAVDFLVTEERILDDTECIINVPPSNLERPIQPVIEVAKGISSELGIKYYGNLLLRTKATPELKNIDDLLERKKLLKDAFSIDKNKIRGKNILLLDDLYRSGSTLEAITEVLHEEGEVNKVNVLVLTKTRTLR